MPGKGAGIKNTILLPLASSISLRSLCNFAAAALQLNGHDGKTKQIRNPLDPVMLSI